MSKNVLSGLLFVLVTGFAFGQGEGFKRDTAWEEMLSRNPAVADDPSVGWMDRLILDVLTPEQARAYFAGKASDEDLTLADGETLAAYVDKKLNPEAHVYIPLASPCRLFDLPNAGTDPGIQTLQSRGDDLNLQGGSDLGCAIPEEAATLVLQLQVESVSGFPTRAKLWSADGPEPAGIFHEDGAFEFPLSYETTLVVPVCGDCSQGEFQLKLSEAAAITAEVVGYFRPMAGGDQPGGFGGGVSFITETTDETAVGDSALANNVIGSGIDDGENNSAFGKDALHQNTTGDGNTAVGYAAGFSNTEGLENSFFGSWAGQDSTGNGNSFFGSGAGGNNTTGSWNSIFGTFSGNNNTTGHSNAIFGIAAAGSNTVEAENTFIGARSDLDPGPDPDTSPVNNATAIGSRAYVSQSNSLVLGSINGVNTATADVSVGIGTTAPESPLHVKRTDGTAQILVEDTGTESTLTTLHMKNNGRVQAVYENTDTGATWQLSQHLTGFIISLVGTGGSEFRVLNDGGVLMGPGAATTFDLDAAGNLIIAGTLTELSDRDEKENIVPVDSKEVFEQVAQLPIARWTRKGDDEAVRHVGPMAQDFYQAFDLGVDNRHLATIDTSGIALAAIQGLNEKLQAEKVERDAEIESLKAELAEIRQMLAAR